MKESFGKMNNKLRVLAVLFVLTMISCKKDKLKGDYSVLLGEWVWMKTPVYYVDACYWEDDVIHTPQSTGNTAKIIFEKKGKVTFYKDEEIVQGYKLKFDYFDFYGDVACFGISSLNEEFSFSGCVQGDTLRNSNDFPYEIWNCIYGAPTNYFIRK